MCPFITHDSNTQCKLGLCHCVEHVLGLCLVPKTRFRIFARNCKSGHILFQSTYVHVPLVYLHMCRKRCAYSCIGIDSKHLICQKGTTMLP